MKGVCDVNSYAPRDYSNIQINNRLNDQVKKISYDQYKKNKLSIEDEGWYLRVDNNGWRPISEKYIGKPDFIQIFSANKVKYYHHKKEKRAEKSQKKVRMNKIRWMQKLYKEKKEEEEGGQFMTAQVQEHQNPFEDPKFINLTEQQFEEEANDLIEWSQALDYDHYLTNWHEIATSNVTNVLSPEIKYQSIYESNA